MKVIDLLNKIANGKEYRNCNLIWHSKITGKNEEENINVLDFICERLFCQDLTLNDEVEIVEEPEEKKIPEKLRIEQDTPNSNYYIRNENGTKCCLTKHSKIIAETLNQVIDYLKSKGE